MAKAKANPIKTPRATAAKTVAAAAPAPAPDTPPKTDDLTHQDAPPMGGLPPLTADQAARHAEANQRVADKVDAQIEAKILAANPPAATATAAFTRIEQVRGLPEANADMKAIPVTFAPGSIKRFKASDTDRRTMEVVAIEGCGFAVRAVATD